jgi:hypothetical protein
LDFGGFWGIIGDFGGFGEIFGVHIKILGYEALVRPDGVL